MLLRSFLPLILAIRASSASNTNFTPQRISHFKLTSDSYDLDLVETLSTDGIISITDIPDFNDLKKSLMTYLHTCLTDMETGGDTVYKSEYNDGTVRRTMASVTIPGPGGARPFDYDESSANCVEFAKGLDSFRKIVDSTTEEFATRLSIEMGTSLKAPLMNTKNGDYSFNEFKDVVREGDHLEHFHSYQKVNQSKEESSNTIDLHTDQGLFIAFTPALMAVHEETSGKPDLNAEMNLSESFYIETKEGNVALVDLSAVDDLVFMMGDGVNQYINPMLNEDEESASKKLRATPHAVALPSHDTTLARVWYGLMVLPPSSAYNEMEGETYGTIRNLLTSLDEKDIPNGLGCSSKQMRALEGGDGCHEEGGIECWHRCMPLELYGVSHETCVGENFAIKCVNPRNQVSTGAEHGDFFPKCTDSNETATPYPPLPYPEPDPVVCSAEAWDDFNTGEGYDFTFNMTTDRTEAFFHWTPNVEAGTVKGRLTFNGQYGWLSFGFTNLDPEARHNGMNGAHVLMGTPGNAFTYDPAIGLNLADDDMVAEYVIDESGSSFRHWHTPVGDTTAEVIPGECFTSMEFELDHIHETKFDVEGSNVMLWAGNSGDYYVGYHLRNRAIFTVHWTTGVVNFGKELESPIVGAELLETDGEYIHDPSQGEYDGPIVAESDAPAETDGDEKDQINAQEESDATSSSAQAHLSASVIVSTVAGLLSMFI